MENIKPERTYMPNGVNLLMIKSLIQAREFYSVQRVSVTDGEGITKSFEFDSGDSVYLVKMPLGSKPDFGRMGAETTILLSQEELLAI
jgi:hypothetical protein